jgi:hypothetical protein
MNVQSSRGFYNYEFVFAIARYLYPIIIINWDYFFLSRAEAPEYGRIYIHPTPIYNVPPKKRKTKLCSIMLSLQLLLLQC